MLNVARSLSAANVNVYLCSLALIQNEDLDCCQLDSGIFFLRSKGEEVNRSPQISNFLHSVGRFMKTRDSDRVIYLYPTVFVIKDFFYFIFFKVLRRYRFYCDVNELRVTNASPITSSENTTTKILARLKSFSDHIIYRLSELQVPFYDGIVVISTNLERYFARYTGKIVRVPILCDTSKTGDMKPVSGLTDGAFRICFAGSVNCRKEGFDILLEAMSRVIETRDVELYLYGMMLEKDRKELNRLMEKYRLDKKVHSMGNIEPDELQTVFPKYNLLIIPRPLIPQTNYGFSTKLSEYLISGVPVLVTDVSDNSVYIKDNYNGYIISPGSSVLMAEKIIEIIERYNDHAPLIVKNALATAREVFDYKLYSQKFVNFFFRNLGN